MAMTREDIIRLVREAGWSGIYTQWAEPTGKPGWSPFKESLTVPVTMKQIERFAALVAAAEREACAKVCEDSATPRNDAYQASYVLRDCADDIRARSEE